MSRFDLALDRHCIVQTLYVFSSYHDPEKIPRVDPWRANHFLGKNFPEQACYVEMMEGCWKTFLVIKLDSPSRGRIRALKPQVTFIGFRLTRPYTEVPYSLLLRTFVKIGSILFSCLFKLWQSLVLAPENKLSFVTQWCQSVEKAMRACPHFLRCLTDRREILSLIRFILQHTLSNLLSRPRKLLRTVKAT
jgi:hypothetical protein